MADSVCAALWSHAMVEVSMKVLPCCRWEEPQGPNTNAPHISNGIQSAIDSDYFNSIREKMLASEEIPQCKQCTDEEKACGTSLRKSFNNRYSQYINTTPKIRDLELVFSTHCNLACRMCGSEASSKWALIDNPGLNVDTSVVATELKNYDHDMSELDNIKMVGGEPFLAKDHYKYLESFISQSNRPKNITLTYHTNGTIFPNQNIINYWKKIKTVHIIVSVDAHGKLNNYLRPGSTNGWETINKNIQKFKNIEGVNTIVKTHTVITSINALHLHKLIEWIDQTIDNGLAHASFDVTSQPDHLSVMHLVDSEKLKIRNYINYTRNKLSNINNIEKIVGILELGLDETPEKRYTIADIATKEKHLDDYFKQDFWSNQ